MVKESNEPYTPIKFTKLKNCPDITINFFLKKNEGILEISPPSIMIYRKFLTEG